MLDLRWPIGLLFTLVGTLLVLTGLLSGSEAHQRSLGININLWWGLLLFVFGGLMTWFAWRAKNPPEKPGAKGGGTP
jgi:hypothetical protein